MTKTAAILALLCSCATVAPAIPSSLPYVHIDPALPGVVMSREAAIVMTMKRAQALAECSARIVDCETARKIAEAEAKEAEKYAEQAGWWSKHGPGLMIGVGFGAFSLGVILSALFGGFFNAHR